MSLLALEVRMNPCGIFMQDGDDEETRTRKQEHFLTLTAEQRLDAWWACLQHLAKTDPESLRRRPEHYHQGSVRVLRLPQD